MSLHDEFNKYEAEKTSDSVLRVKSGYHYYYYDFAQRIMTAAVHHGGSSTPFSQLDRDVLVEARDKLVALGGKPPELPPEASAPQAPTRKFNL